jgi:two-component system chemotaxis response regulator CheB
MMLELVVIGGSAGSLDALSELLPALSELLPALPPGWRVPVVIAVHLPQRAPSVLADVLRAQSRLPVLEAEDKQPLAGGAVHVARPGYHLLVDAGPRLALAVDEPVNFSIPSIDVLFESAAAACGPGVAAIVLSGANDDGARGLAAVRAAGGVAVVQEPGDARVDVMPRAALRGCPDAKVLPARALAEFLGGLAAEAT